MDWGEEREELLAQLTGYLEELQETGVEELYFAPEAVPVSSGATATPADQPAAARPAPAEPAAPPLTSADTAASRPTPARPAGPEARSAAPARPPRAPRPFRAIGNPKAKFFLVMNGDGFNGEAGDLLAKIVQAMGFTGKEVCLLCFAAVPPTGEVLKDALLDAIRSSRPEIVVVLGTPALRLLLEESAPIQEVRGRLYEIDGIQFMPTLHPEALLRDPSLKRPVWDDMQQVMRLLGKQRP